MYYNSTINSLHGSRNVEERVKEAWKILVSWIHRWVLGKKSNAKDSGDLRREPGEEGIVFL